MDPTDPLQVILSELGPAPSPSLTSQSEVHLTLVNRFAKVEDESERYLRKLMNDTKRLVIMTIRIQAGRNLLDILEAPVTQQQEEAFQAYRDADAQRFREAAEKKEEQTWRLDKDQSISNQLEMQAQGMTSTGSLFYGSGSYFCLKADEKNTLTYTSLKRKTLENMAKLEAAGVITKNGNYQDMLNSIAKDMLNRHRRKFQRKREFASLQKTLRNLSEKAVYLEEQKSSYNDYINSCITQLNKKTGKSKKAPLPFTRQYFHLKELQKSGTMPQFGSFKYTAAELLKKGVIVSIDENVPKNYNQIMLTLSSDEPGVFVIEASVLGVKMSDRLEIRVDELLQHQYNGIQAMTLFDIAKVNVNLLTYLLNKKFYV